MGRIGTGAKRILLALLTAALLCGTALAFAGCKKEEGVKITEIAIIDPTTGKEMPQEQWSLVLDYTGNAVVLEYHLRVKGEKKNLDDLEVRVSYFNVDEAKDLTGPPVEKGIYQVRFIFFGLSEIYHPSDRSLGIVIQ